MKPVDRPVIIGAFEVIAERARSIKQTHAEPFPAAVRLEDEWAATETLPGGLHEQLLAGDEDRVRRPDAGLFEGGVLARLTYLEVERAAAVDDAPPVPLEPGQHRGGQFGGVAVIAGVRGGAHPVIEAPHGRRLRQIEDAAIDEPVTPGEPLPI